MDTLLLFTGGLAALIIGASALVHGAARLALLCGISPLVVGLTVVAFGTSSPEVAVSVGSVLDGRTDIAIGNVVGSNIFNVLFILGVSALIVPLLVHSQVIRQEVPVMIGASALLLVLILDGSLGPGDGALLLVLLLGYTAYLVVQSRRETQTGQAQQASDASAAPGARRWHNHWSAQVVLVVAGLALLVLGARWFVEASVVTARAFGVSDLVIGLTIVAAGTSLPEVATSIAAAIKGQRDIAVGNVIGSNTFNILGCLGLSAVAAGGQGLAVAPAVVNFDVWVMLAVALACLPIFISGRTISRWEGGVFLLYYVAYAAYLVLAATQHDALPAFSRVMLGFVLPITVVTLSVVLLSRPRPRAHAPSPPVSG